MYAACRRERRGRETAYRSLVFQSLQNIPQGKYIPRSLGELMRPRQEVDVDAIIDRVISAIEGGEDEPA